MGFARRRSRHRPAGGLAFAAGLMFLAGAARAQTQCNVRGGPGQEDTALEILITSPLDGSTIDSGDACSVTVDVSGGFSAKHPVYEFFFVIEGKLLLDLEGRTVELTPRQGMMVPRGVLHRTRAPQRTVVLMIEAATVVPTGD